MRGRLTALQLLYRHVLHVQCSTFLYSSTTTAVYCTVHGAPNAPPRGKRDKWQMSVDVRSRQLVRCDKLELETIGISTGNFGGKLHINRWASRVLKTIIQVFFDNGKQRRFSNFQRIKTKTVNLIGAVFKSINISFQMKSSCAFFKYHGDCVYFLGRKIPMGISYEWIASFRRHWRLKSKSEDSLISSWVRQLLTKKSLTNWRPPI